MVASANEWHALPIVAEAAVSETFGPAVTHGSMSYALRASPQDVEDFQRRAKRDEDALAAGKMPSGQDGAGRFFAARRDMPVYDLRAGDTNIDREGVLVLQKPGGENSRGR